MPYTPKQISASDQLIATARDRLNTVLPRMRALIADHANIEPELAQLARDTVSSLAKLPDTKTRTEAIANMAMLETVAIYELAKQPVQVPLPINTDGILGGWEPPEIVLADEGQRYEAIEAALRVEITAAVRRTLYQTVAAGDSGKTTLDTLADAAVAAMSDYLAAHYLREQRK